MFFLPKDGTDALEYCDGLGSTDPDRHIAVGRAATKKSPAELLDNASTFKDDDLAAEFRDFLLDRNDAAVKDLLSKKGAKKFARRDASLSGGMRELLERLGSDESLAVAIGDEHEAYGLLVVDRRWQNQDLTQTDNDALESFAQQTAALVLRQHMLSQQLLEGHELATMGFVFRSLTHDLRQPLHSLRLDPGSLRQMLDEEDWVGAGVTAKQIEEQVDVLAQIVRDQELFLKPEVGYEVADVERLLREAVEMCRVRPGATRIEFLDRAANGLPHVRIITPLVRRALMNILSNAIQAINREKKFGKIEIDANYMDDLLTITVRDDGPGMTKQILEKVRRRGGGFTGNPSKGLGIGLEIVRRVAEVHQCGNSKGSVLIDSAEGIGTVVTIRLPV